MKLLTIVLNMFGVVAAIALILAILVGLPLLFLVIVNFLFGTGIELNFMNWLAALGLLMVTKS